MTQEQYIKALQMHDWGYDFADDHRVWTMGRDSLNALRAVQPVIDADFSIWNAHCAPGYQVEVQS